MKKNRGEEMNKRKKKKKRKGMDDYDFVCKLFVYGFIWTLVCSISRV